MDRRLRAAGLAVVPDYYRDRSIQYAAGQHWPAAEVVARGEAGCRSALLNSADAGAIPRCTASPADPPGSYVGVQGRFGLQGGPVLINRSAQACDYATAARNRSQFRRTQTGCDTGDRPAR